MIATYCSKVNESYCSKVNETYCSKVNETYCSKVNETCDIGMRHVARMDIAYGYRVWILLDIT